MMERPVPPDLLKCRFPITSWKQRDNIIPGQHLPNHCQWKRQDLPRENWEHCWWFSWYQWCGDMSEYCQVLISSNTLSSGQNENMSEEEEGEYEKHVDLLSGYAPAYNVKTVSGL